MPDETMRTPGPRGPLSAFVLARFDGASINDLPAATDVATPDDVVADDLHLALYLCYELHYGSGDRLAPAELEWDPQLLGLRRVLEHRFEAALRSLAPPPTGSHLDELVPKLVATVGGGSVAGHMEDRGTLQELRELLIHRSPYLLKEGDPHTWAIPRLNGLAKRRLVEIQAGEYGVEEANHVMHADLFGRAMQAADLDARPNAYLDDVPGVSLAVSNLVSLFGLHRQLRGALAGHLALFETTSVESMRRHVRALDRLQQPADVRRFFAVHVVADAVHEDVARAMLTALLEAEPDLRADVEFGIAAALIVERAFADHLLDHWERGVSSLRGSRRVACFSSAS